MEILQLFVLIGLIAMVFILVSLIHSMGQSEQSKIRKCRRMLKRKYKEKNLEFIRKTKLAGDYFYLFRTEKTAYTVRENGCVTISKLE